MRYQNVYLLQVRHVIRDGGPWASPVLEGILKEVEQRQEEGVLRFFSFNFFLFYFNLFIFKSLTAKLQTIPSEHQWTFCFFVTVCCTVDRYLSSEVSVFFELRVRYLLACERTREAMALALKCSQHPTSGRRLFFKQAYLTCLWKSSQQERLFTEVRPCSRWNGAIWF